MITSLAKTFLSSILYTISITVFSQIHVVDNNPNSGAVYTEVQDAIDAASPGDTIIVAGSETSYGTATLNKQLVLIGAGFRSPEPEQFGYTTQLNTLRVISTGTTVDASGSHIEGFDITGRFSTSTCCVEGFRSMIVEGADGFPLENVTFTRNNLGSVHVSRTINLLFYNNIIGVIGARERRFFAGSGGTLVRILNNVITGGISNFSNGVVSYNMFVGSNSTAFDEAFGDVRTSAITNNIFYGKIVGSGLGFCTITHNLFMTEVSDDTFDFGTNSEGNNIEYEDPLFVDVPNYGFSHDYDYELQISSLAKTASTSDGEIGIYGGPFPFPIGGEIPYKLSPQTQLPKITDFNIKTGTVAEGETVEAEFGARVSTNQ